MMNNFYRSLTQCNRFILIIPIILSIAGILTIAGISCNAGTFPSREVIIQSAALLAGIIMITLIMKLGCRYFTDLEWFIYIISVFFLLSVYIPGAGTTFYGSRAWLDIGFITIQPSEFVKTSFVIIMASYLTRRSGSLQNISEVLKAALYGVPFILIVAKEDFGSGCVFCAIWLFMVFCRGLELEMLAKSVLVLAAASPLFYYFLAGYQKDRIDAYFNPDDLDLPGNYQVWNAKAAVGSGGLWGKGYMNGTQAQLGFLPVPESDFVFAATVEDFGFLGGAAIILLFTILIIQILKTAKYASDLEGTLICAGFAGMFTFQAFENIAMNMGIMPVTGITLPFMSYGGSSMLSSMMSIGFILDVSCRQKL